MAQWIVKNQNKRRCQCGCGNFVQPNLHRWYQDRSLRFLPHHQSRGKHHGHYKGGKVLAKGYVWILRPDHPRRTKRNYVKRCWLVVEKSLGRFLRQGELVHHKNGVRTDDRRRNLEVSNPVSHGKIHCAGERNPAWRHDISCAAVQKLRERGLLVEQIARELDCASGTVLRRCKT
jgi:hypothetical protein